MKNLAVIPARGGSKGLPGKNIMPLHGKPLIAWTILAAKAAACIASVIVSSEDPAILDIAEQWGAQIPFARPEKLAEDASSNIDVVLHALDFFERNGEPSKIVTLLQPTSPLRTAADIENAFAVFENTGAPACISMTACEHPPQWNCRIENGRIIPPVSAANKRRQNLDAYYRPNGAIYIAKTEWLRATKSFFTEETAAYVMPQERSVDIDDFVDFAMAEMLATLNGKAVKKPL